MTELYIGLMSGTSLDGVDGVLVDHAVAPPRVVSHAYSPFSPELKAAFLALNQSGPDELHRAALAANALARVYASVVHALRVGVGSDVIAIGAHGQTVRHQPQAFDATGYTLQINNPALLAELTGIDVVADFRSRDVAAGGQGAPLVPAFHQAAFGQPGEAIAVLNIGGIANLTVLGQNLVSPSGENILGFDCGPGNALMDGWCQQHTGQPYDAGGAWAASGAIHPGLLSHFLQDAYFAKAPPKSTGRDLFNADWLSGNLAGFPQLTPVDVQATLTELTAVSCAACVNSYGNESKRLLVCGGGALNTWLMARLQQHLPACIVESSQHHGLPPLQVEAAAFAWLARQAILRKTASLKSVTGARGARILGAIYPA
jgi:anhydro-N-acetylmuramic acid kinase